jgi:hypothetical protein
MQIRNQKDFWAGLMFVAFSAGFALVGRGRPQARPSAWAPAVFRP